MKRNELAYTEAIHKRSRRMLQAALRRSAADAETAAGWRRLTSNSTINAANAKMVTKKNQTLATMGPTIAISRLEERSTPFSESSRHPVIISAPTPKKRKTLLTR